MNLKFFTISFSIDLLNSSRSSLGSYWVKFCSQGSMELRLKTFLDLIKPGLAIMVSVVLESCGDA